jgi:hypothetical protein
MGVYLGLKLMPQRIGHDEWHEVYEDSLALLKAWPKPMMGLKTEQIGSVKRRIFSRDIERERDNPDKRNWHVVGDFESKQTGESFVLYWDLNHYRYGKPHLPEATDDSDIVASIISEKTDHIEVFFAKTQGCPYHFAILGVAMLVEDRFPKYALASGDIDIHQAKRAQELVKSLIGKSIALPVCVDGPRLLQRIGQHCRGKEAIGYFQKIYRGDSHKKFETLYSQCGDSFADWFVDELRSYQSPAQLRVIDLSMGWLDATGDLQSLCEIACLREDGPKFDPVKFAGALASTWISLDEPTRGVLNPFRKPEGEADTVMSQLGSVFFDLRGLKGRGMEFHMPEEEVFKVFYRLFPEHGGQMEQAFGAKTQALKKDLEECRPGMERLESRSKEEPESGDGSSIMALESFDQASPRQKILLEGMAYVIDRMRPKILEETPQLLEGGPKQLLEKIIDAANCQGLTLTEDAWNWLDNESDPEFLKYVLCLAIIDDQRLSFWNLRKGMLENRALCLAAFEMSKDPTFPERMEALIKTHA